MLAFMKVFREQGFTAGEIDRMARRNPAKLLAPY
jgi:predicted metal-dependent phosphotriesterase family hydrolase